MFKKNKTAIQWDAYRPLFTVPGGLPRHRPSSVQGGLPGQRPAPGQRPRPPPVDRQTPVEILPCPKLLLRAVIVSFNVNRSSTFQGYYSFCYRKSFSNHDFSIFKNLVKERFDDNLR